MSGRVKLVVSHPPICPLIALRTSETSSETSSIPTKAGFWRYLSIATDADLAR